MDRNEAFRREKHQYLIGFFASLLMTVLAFGVVIWPVIGVLVSMVVAGIAALAQIYVQLRYILHIEPRTQRKADLQLMIFTSLIVLIMLVGTVWVLGNLAERMHMH